MISNGTDFMLLKDQGTLCVQYFQCLPSPKHIRRLLCKYCSQKQNLYFVECPVGVDTDFFLKPYK